MDTNITATEIAEGSALFGALADPIRLDIFHRLSAGGECVCNLQTTPPIPDNLLSYHLRILRDAGLVVSERRGRRVFYQLAPGILDRLHNCLPVSAPTTDQSV
ncbi:ArsR/SmtB family transcription factor [Arcanobacterium phocae]|uniref:ArsR/SmtB family transcription factor n=1 Tax=Arcanobacterium phocae TaxID=131112 RepID=UPI001C0F0459|nr:metalloregulator ArsR/SmtB family transcription factor [Arcanobacterium phocae]